MAKTINKRTSKINRKSKNDNKLNRHRLNSIQRKRKGSSNFKIEHPTDTSYQPNANTYPSLLCDSENPADNYSQLESENNLRCSSAPDPSSMNELVDLTVDLYECINIEDDDIDDAHELKNASPEPQEQSHLYPTGTSLIQNETDENSQIRKQFEKDIKVLQDGILSQIVERPHRINPNLYFNVIKRLNKNCFIKQLLREKVELEKELQKIKKNLNEKCDLIVDKIRIIQSVYHPIQNSVKFSMWQRKVILSNVKKMGNIKKSILNKHYRNKIDIPSCDSTEFLPKESIACLCMRDEEMIDTNVSTDIPFLPEELSVDRSKKDEVTPRNNLYESEVFPVIEPNVNKEKVISNESSPVLQNQELIDAKLKVSILLEQLKATQDELMKVRNEMNEQMNSSQQNADREEMKTKVQLSEIRAMVKEKMGVGDILESSLKEVTCQSILWDIRWLLEEYGHNEHTENITDTSMTSDGLKVTENEVHLVIMIAFFLKVIPFSVTTEFIHTYLKNIDNSISLQFVTSLLNKFPTVFKEESFGAGTLEKKWCYLSLSPVITI